jgi:hypothetical protein
MIVIGSTSECIPSNAFRKHKEENYLATAGRDSRFARASRAIAIEVLVNEEYPL